MPAGSFYDEARHWMAWDTNDSGEGCLEGGATKVVVCDFHTRLSISWNEIHPNAILVRSDPNASRIVYLMDSALPDSVMPNQPIPPTE